MCIASPCRRIYTKHTNDPFGIQNGEFRRKVTSLHPWVYRDHIILINISLIMQHRIYSIIKRVLDLGSKGWFNQISNIIISNNNKSCSLWPCFLLSWKDGWIENGWVDKEMSIWKAEEVERSSNNWRVWGSNPSSCSLHLEKSLGKRQNPNLL